MKMRRQRAGINSFRGDGWISYRYGYRYHIYIYGHMDMGIMMIVYDSGWLDIIIKGF